MWNQNAAAQNWGQTQSWQAAGQAQWQRQQQPQQQPQQQQYAAAQQAAQRSPQPPLPPGGVRPPPAPGRPEATVPVIAFTEGTDGGEFVIQTLVGEFLPQGENHGRPFFRKAPVRPGTLPPEVFLYYWDERDGPGFNGWWFGKSVGGNEVWSHNAGTTATPPNRGWKIPFAGPVRETFCVMSKVAQGVQGKPAQNPEKEKRVQELADGITKAVAEASGATEKAKATVGGYSNVDALKESEKLLVPYTTLLADLEKKLQAIGSSSEMAKTFSQKLRFTLTGLSAELQKIRMAVPKAQHMKVQQELEAKDRAALALVLQEIEGKATAAEELVEKTVAVHAQIEQAGSDMPEASKAVEETEVAAKKAQAAIKEGLTLIGLKLTVVRGFQNHRVRNEAPEGINVLREKLRLANNKLLPMLNVKADFRLRTIARQVSDEVNTKLAAAEVAIDNAESAVTPLRSGAVSAELVKQVEVAVAEATEKLGQAQKLMELRMRTAAGPVREALTKVEESIRASHKRLEDVRGVYREVQERQTCSSLLPEVGEKLHAVHQAVNSLETILSPIIMGDDRLSLDETLTAIRAGDEAMKVATKAGSAAKICIAMKKVEVKRFKAEAGQEAQRQLNDYQKELDVAMKKVNDLKNACTESKQVALRNEVEARVAGAEQLLQQAADAVSRLGDEEELTSLPLDEVQARGAAVHEAQQGAQKAVREAQELLTQRQIEAKGSGAPESDTAMLKACQERLRHCQVEVAKFGSLPPIVEQQLALKMAVDEACKKVGESEEKVNRAANMVGELNSAGSDAKKGAELAQGAVNNAQVALKGVARYLEVQQRVGKVPKEEMVKLLGRMAAAQGKLDSLHTAMQEGAEKLALRSLIQEVELRVKEAEDTVQRASEVAAPVLAADAGEGATSDALAKLKEATAGGSKALGSAKTFLAVKKIAAKRLSADMAKMALDELAVLQGRLDGAGKALGELQRGTSDRKYLRLKQDAAAKIKEVEEKAVAFKAAVDALEENDDKDIEPLAMKEIFERAGASQQEAQQALDTVRPMLAGPLREAKPGESGAVAEIKELLDKLKPIQEELAKHKKRLGDREQKFVAKRLLKDAVQMFEDLDGKLERTGALALPLISEKPEERKDFVAAALLARVAGVLRRKARKAEQSLEVLFEEVSGGKDARLTEEQFVSFVRALPELADDAPPTEEQLRSAFSWMSPEGSADAGLEDFLGQVRGRYVCRVPIAMTETVEAAKSVRKLEVREVVEAIDEPEQDATKGIARIKVKAEKDGKEGYCAIAGNQGTVFLEPWSRYAEHSQSVETALSEAGESLHRTMAHLKQKSEEISALQGMGALGEVKAELMKMRVRASQAQTRHTSLKKRVQEAQKRHEAQVAQEQLQRKQREQRAAATAFLEEVRGAADGAQAELDAAAGPAEELQISEGRWRGQPFEDLAKAEAAAQAVLTSVTSQQESIKRKSAAMGGSVDPEATETRQQTMRQAKRLVTMEERCRLLLASLRHCRVKVLLEARAAMAAALKGHAERTGLAPDALFADLSGGGEEVTKERLRGALLSDGIEGSARSQMEFCLEHLAHLTRIVFLGLFQEYKRCVKEIALTTEFSVKGSATVRKLDFGEILEVIGKPDLEEKTGLTRVKCRVCRDLVEGWVTLKGNQGTAFLEDASKPFFACESEAARVPLTDACESGSLELRQVRFGEVFELLEGPRREAALGVSRVRGTLLSDGQSGWATLQEPGAASQPNFERVPLLVCRGSIALTSAFEISSCVALRKLEVGEVCEQIGEPQEDLTRKLCRVNIRTRSDGKEGWATLKGNQGTVYLSESTSHYICKRAVPLEKDITSGEGAVRQIEEGELFEVLEGPCVESKQGALLARGRSLRGGDVGWFPVTAEMRPWSAQHRCAQATDLRDAADASSATVLRPLEQGESLEALEPPTVEADPRAEAVELVLRLRAAKDGAVGFASVFLPSGARALEPRAAAPAAPQE